MVDGISEGLPLQKSVLQEGQSQSSIESNKSKGKVDTKSRHGLESLTLEDFADREPKPGFWVDRENEGVSVEDFKERYEKYFNQAKGLLEDAKEKLSKRDGESDFNYQQRVINEVKKRLRYPGSFTLDDDLFKLIQDEPQVNEMIDRADLVLMGVEACEADLLENEKEGMGEDPLRNLNRRSVKTKVSRGGEPAYIEGPFEPYFERNAQDERVKREMPQKDLYAFALVADRLLDVQDTDGKTFREKMQKLKEEKKHQELVSLRRRFYETSIEAMRNIDVVATRYSDRFDNDQTIIDMISTLKDVGQISISDLVDEYKGVSKYKGVSRGLREKHKTEIKKFLTDRVNLLEYALKGADLMNRRISYSQMRSRATRKIHYKDFNQSQSAILDVSRGSNKGGGSDDGGGENLSSKTEPEPEPAPEPAPKKEPKPEPKKESEPELPPAPKAETDPPLALPLITDFNLSFVADYQQVAKEARGGVDFQMQLGQSKQGLVKKFVSGIWQRSFFSSLFREREERFRRNILAKTGLNYLPNDLVKSAMGHGKEITSTRSWFRRNLLDRVYNLGANLIGLRTTDQVEAENWLVKEVNLARSGDDQADQEVKQIYSQSSEQREAFGARLALENNQFACHQGEERQIVEDEKLQEYLAEDFFKLMVPYINGKMTDEQARELIDQYCEQGAEINGENLRLRNRIPSFQSQFAVVGSNMRRVAEYLKENKDRYKLQGIVQEPENINSWLSAFNASDSEKKINFKIYTAQAEISAGGRVESKMERAFRLLKLRNERAPAILGNGSIAKGYNFFAKTLMGLGMNEITAATVGGYAGSFLASFIPTSSSKAKMIAGAGGIYLPFMVASTTVGLPVAVPIAGAAMTAGVFSGIREVLRLRKERTSIEREASFNILPSDVQVNVGRAGGFLRRLYGHTSRKELMEYIANQKESSFLMKGLLQESGLFSNPDNLTSKMPEDISADQIKTALRWLVETKARIDLTSGENRRFIRYDSQLSEARQQEILDGASQEVYERLNYLFEQNDDLKNSFLTNDIASFDALYSELVSAYEHTLLGDSPSEKSSELTQTLGETEVLSLLEEEQSLRARDRAFNRLVGRKALHRGFGTIVSSLALGQGMVELRSHLQGTPPSVIGHWLGEGKKMPPVGPGNSQIDFADVHFKPPQGFTFDHETHELVSPEGQSIDLDNFVENNQFQWGKFLTEAHQIGIEFDHKDMVDLLPGNTHEVVLGHTTINLPDSVTIDDQNNDGLIHQIDFNGTKVDVVEVVGHALNPNDKQDLNQLSAILKSYGFEPGKIQETVSRVKETTDEVLNRIAHPIDHKEWYANNTKTSDFNELKEYTFSPDGEKVILDMSKMGEAFQRGLPTVDVQDVIKHGQAGFYVSIPGREHLGVWIPVNSRTGQVTINPNDTTHFLPGSDGQPSDVSYADLYKIMINKAAVKKAFDAHGSNIATELNNHREVFNIARDGHNGYIHAGMIVNENGKKVFRSFATIEGSGSPPLEIRKQIPSYVLSAPSRTEDVINLQYVEHNDEFAVGVMPLPYTEYADLGKQEFQSNFQATPLPPHLIEESSSVSSQTPIISQPPKKDYEEEDELLTDDEKQKIKEEHESFIQKIKKEIEEDKSSLTEDEFKDKWGCLSGELLTDEAINNKAKEIYIKRYMAEINNKIIKRAIEGSLSDEEIRLFKKINKLYLEKQEEIVKVLINLEQNQYITKIAQVLGVTEQEINGYNKLHERITNKYTELFDAKEQAIIAYLKELESKPDNS